MFDDCMLLILPARKKTFKGRPWSVTILMMCKEGRS